jgi:hypothetical protein
MRSAARSTAGGQACSMSAGSVHRVRLDRAFAVAHMGCRDRRSTPAVVSEPGNLSAEAEVRRCHDEIVEMLMR